MKAYLTVSGGVFALVALAHVLRTIAEWSRLARDPWFVLVGPGVGAIAMVLAIWAFRLRRQTRAG